MSTKDAVRRIREETAQLLASHRRELAEARRQAIERARWDQERRIGEEKVRQAFAHRDARARQAFLADLRAEVQQVCASARPAAPQRVAKPTLLVAREAPARAAAPAQAAPAPAEESLPEVDDLTQIEGISAAVQRRLYLAGIFSFEQLANTPTSVLNHIVGAGHPTLSWQTRARQLRAGLAG